MKRKYGAEEYTSSFIEDRAQGFGGYELLRVENGKEHRVATVIFWDAMGQYFVGTFGDVPLVILEALIAETRAAIGEK
jgi:hypothetical protein